MKKYKRAIIKMVEEIREEEALERIYNLVVYWYIWMEKGEKAVLTFEKIVDFLGEN